MRAATLSFQIFALMLILSPRPSDAACKQVTLTELSASFPFALVPGFCVGFGTSSFMATCTPTNKTISIYQSGTCTGTPFAVSYPLNSQDVCGAADTICATTMKFYENSATCSGSGVQNTFTVVPGPTSCLGGAQFYCSNNQTFWVFRDGGASCTGNVGSILQVPTGNCLSFGNTAILSSQCVGGPAPPAGPSTASGAAYAQLMLSGSSTCGGTSVGKLTQIADGTCVTGSKVYCQNSEIVSVSYQNGSLCTGQVTSVSRQPTGTCAAIGNNLWATGTCNAGSSPATSSATVQTSTVLQYDTFTSSTCTTKFGSSTVAANTCIGGNQKYECLSSSSAVLKSYSSSSGPCNDSQTSPAIVQQSLGSSCTLFEGSYVKVTACGANAATRVGGALMWVAVAFCLFEMS